MVFASYYVIEYIMSAFENRDKVDECFEIFEKMVYRYSEDKELNRVYEKFRNFFPIKNFNELVDIKTDLKRLRDTRRLMTNYGISPLLPPI